MNIKNCRRCKGIFQYQGSKYCPQCMQELDGIFIKVREYIYENPEATIIEVSEELDVDRDIIIEFLREGRLVMEFPDLDFVCERCEKPIVTGRFCNDCIGELEQEMRKGLIYEREEKKEVGRDSNKMYTAEYRRRRRKF